MCPKIDLKKGDKTLNVSSTLVRIESGDYEPM